CLCVSVVSSPPTLRAEPPSSSLAKVAEQVNQKMVKLFGSGGFRGLNSYGTGIIISPDGYVLTVASPLLDTADLRVHLADGRRRPGYAQRRAVGDHWQGATEYAQRYVDQLRRPGPGVGELR